MYYAIVLRTLTAVTIGWLGSSEEVTLPGGTILESHNPHEGWTDSQGRILLLPLGDDDAIVDDWIIVDDSRLVEPLAKAAAEQQRVRDREAFTEAVTGLPPVDPPRGWDRISV